VTAEPGISPTGAARPGTAPVSIGRRAGHEVAAVVAFLAGGGGRFISGQVICVDGGSQCWPA
jgi:NAD(P)-dependent dehydrogenase (short-subunit alcohol dehydrogenase family)